MITPFSPPEKLLRESASADAYFGWDHHVFFFMSDFIGHSEYCPFIRLDHDMDLCKHIVDPSPILHVYCHAWEHSGFNEIMTLQVFLENTTKP